MREKDSFHKWNVSYSRKWQASATNEFFNKAKKLSVYKRFNSIEDLKNQVIMSLEAFLISEGRISFEEFDDRINPEIGYE
ncbi:hypothetical protein [Methanobacterium sp.]|uniref:hypothetical protein n=1 Tax=Methanobacterium sp. TaxID=2164 RepID=UPI002ABCC0C2|nr:hypothetical protein [Methanobacterium sp.]MDY9924650.1 hypothetical protein [Methanobacterium sp.]